MTVVTIEEAKERIEELAGLASSGEEVRITRGELPAMELKVAEKMTTGKRVGGQWEGKFVVGPEFFEPLPDELLDLFEGNSPRGRKLEEIGEAWAKENRKATE